MEDDNNILALSRKKKNSELVKAVADSGWAVADAVVAVVSGLPLVGPVMSLGKTAFRVKDRSFFKKVSRFMEQSNAVSDEEKDNFLLSLSDKEYERISSYLVHILESAEEELKAELLGKIYVARVRNEIDNDNLLRLSSIVYRSFYDDLLHLSDYETENNGHSFITGNLLSLGLLEDCGNVYEYEKDGWAGQNFGPSKYRLNEIGRTLQKIMS